MGLFIRGATPQVLLGDRLVILIFEMLCVLPILYRWYFEDFFVRWPY